MKEPIAVIGAGSWGTTLARILGQNGHPTLLWVRDAERRQQMATDRENKRYLPGFPLPDAVVPTADLAEAVKTARLVLVAVPSHGFRAVVQELGNHLCGEHLVIHATKGIEQGSFKRMTEVLREETCVRKLGVLTGPNLAREIAAGHPAGTVIASNYQEVLERWQQALHTPCFRVYQGHDVIGAEVAGAFKNIVAVVAGIVDGMALGDNTRALLLTRGLYEMAQVGVAMGASALTFGGLAGIGDLMATCASPLSRNHQVGVRLAQGETLAQIQGSMLMVAEGVKTTAAIHAWCAYKGLELPIVRAANRILYEGWTVADAQRELLAVPVSRELAELRW